MTDTPKLSAQQLEEAFEAFNRVSHELDTSYRELQSRVAQLTEELTEARSARLRELAEKERLANRLALLMGALPGGVVVLDPNHHVREVNPEAAEMLGFPLAGRPWKEIVQRNACEASGDEHEMVLRDGRHLSVTQRSLPDVNERVILLTDITEMVALKERVDREERLSAMGEMAARLAHQIRTPLSSTLLYVSHLSRPDLEAPDRDRISDKMLGRLRHMEQLVNSMLTFVRGGACGAEPLSAKEMLLGVAEVAEQQLAPVNGQLSIEGALPEVELQGNREALHSALLNLVDNAIDVIGEDVCLELLAEADQSQLRIRLRDNGPGVDRAIRGKIFDPFFTTRVQGTGLGLAVVAMTIRAHGGTIEVGDAPAVEGEPGGAEFCVTLPLRGEEMAADPGAGMWLRNSDGVGAATEKSELNAVANG